MSSAKSCLLAAALGLATLLTSCGGGNSFVPPPQQPGPPPPPPTPDYTGVLMNHNDQGGTGQNLSETALTPANVSQATFGKLFSYPLDGAAYAQPLYVSNVTIAGGAHNVVYVATEHDSVYAFDADGVATNPFWTVNFTDAANGITTVPYTDLGGGQGPIIPEVGITGTPVIGPNSGTLFVVAMTKENGTWMHKLHALDITTGKERVNSPVVIQASVAGTGTGSSGGQIVFQSHYQLQRPGLLLLNGTVYIAFGSFDDKGPYHGWILGYDATSLKQVIAWNDTPNGNKGGIWSSGAALSADAAGNIYAIAGNGTFDANTGGPDYGDTVLKLVPNGNTFTVSDYFTPFDQQSLQANDNDIGSTGFTLLPGQTGAVAHLGVCSAKSGKIYLLNRDNLGKFQAGSDTQIVQSIPTALGSGPSDNDYSTGVYWQGNVYFIGNDDVVKQFQLSNDQLSLTPFAQGTHQYGYPGGNMSVSSNGASGGILWSIEAGGINVLHAYDATDVSKEIYNSNQVGTRDKFGAAIRFTMPTVINGKVYVAGKTELAAFGLL